MIAKSTKWYRANKEAANERGKITNSLWRKNNPEKAKEIRLRAEEKVRNDPEKLLAQRARKRNYRHQNPEGALLHDTRRRAKSKGLVCTLTKDNLPRMGTHCPILGTAFARGIEAWRAGTSPALDRIDNTKGYTPDNVWFISHRANRLKGDGTLEEFEALVRALKDKIR